METSSDSVELLDNNSQCQICYVTPEEGCCSVLSEDIVRLVSTTMLIPLRGEVESISLKLCPKCTDSFVSFSDICSHLETLRCEFNELRRELASRLLSSIRNPNGSLIVSHEEWKTKIESVEHIFPSCIIAEDTEGTGKQISDVEITPINLDDNESNGISSSDNKLEDFKLKKMKPVVLLERLNPSQTIRSNQKKTVVNSALVQRKYFSSTKPGSYINIFNSDNEDDDCPTPILRMLLLTLPGPSKQSKTSTLRSTRQIRKPTRKEIRQPTKKKKPCGPSVCGRNNPEILDKLKRIFKPQAHYKQADFELDFSEESEEELTKPQSPKKRKLMKLRTKEKPTTETHALPLRRLMKKKKKPFRPFQCKVCKKTYKRTDHLSRHMRLIHENGQIKEYECSQCDKKFVYTHNLFRHVQTDHKSNRKTGGSEEGVKDSSGSRRRVGVKVRGRTKGKVL